MWYILEADPGAEIFAGLKRGVNAKEFETRLRAGTVAECVHRIRSKPGGAMFLPSGRIHALGAGHVLFEVQENSDTTYRVFDWNRVGLDGNPRVLHIPQSLASIDFHDFEPDLSMHPPQERDGLEIRPLVNSPEMSVEIFTVGAGGHVRLNSSGPLVLGMAEGQATVQHTAFPVELGMGDFCLVPACLEGVSILACNRSRILVARAGFRLLSG
jgi:mannose-6-phosphate isomerase